MIELKNISKTYQMGKVSVRALRNVSLKISRGEFVAIMGPSGSGKSTLMHLLGFLDRPDSGSYFFGGNDVSRMSDDDLANLRNRMAGFVFQQFQLLSRLTALENVELPLIYAGKRKLKEKAVEKIKAVGLGDRSMHRPSELSGGEQQRVAIARSLVNEPLVIFADEPTGNLDTKNEEEIISVLQGLNDQGKTIVMVTHEREVAERAKRIIFMRNGEIISDELVQKNQKVVSGSVEDSKEEIASRLASKGSRAQFTDHIRQAVYAIFTHKMRSLLSMLGILIGVAAVIAMLALGEGAKADISQRLASLGSNMLMIRPGSQQLHGVALEAGSVTRFTVQDAEAIEKLTFVKRTSPGVQGRVQVVYGNKNTNTQVMGVGVDYALMRSSAPALGRFFNQNELRSRSKEVLLGTTVLKLLFENENPIGKTVKINRINFKVIGILPEKGATSWRDEDDLVVIPITTAMYRLLGKEFVDSIDVEIRSQDQMADAQEAIQKLIIKRHRLNKENEDTFQIRNMAEIQDTLVSTTKTMTWLLGSIAAISLLVGGIGIMNIMLVSVTERTREIGLRKAIGARRSDILSQFLIESIVMTLSGGLLGILVGTGIAVLLSVSAGWTTKISPMSALFATLFSIAVGLIFGLRPAFQASKLNPVETLHYE